jgi:hypothetical protein
VLLSGGAEDVWLHLDGRRPNHEIAEAISRMRRRVIVEKDVSDVIVLLQRDGLVDCVEKGNG